MPLAIRHSGFVIDSPFWFSVPLLKPSSFVPRLPLAPLAGRCRLMLFAADTLGKPNRCASS